MRSDLLRLVATRCRVPTGLGRTPLSPAEANHMGGTHTLSTLSCRSSAVPVPVPRCRVLLNKGSEFKIWRFRIQT